MLVDDDNLANEMAEADAETTPEEINTQEVTGTALTEGEQEILAYVRENNVSLATIRDISGFTNAIRVHASRLNTQLGGTTRDFDAMNIDELRAFVADRKAIASTIGLHGHVAETTNNGANNEPEKLTPAQLAEQNFGGKK